MRKMTTAVLALACVGLTAGGCTRKKQETRKAEAREAIEKADREMELGLDSLDGVMRFQVSRIDPKTAELVLVPSELAEQEIEPQAGQELTLTFSEFRQLTGKSDPAAGDVIQSLEEGGEVIVHGKRLGIPNSADDIERIELPKKD